MKSHCLKFKQDYTDNLLRTLSGKFGCLTQGLMGFIKKVLPTPIYSIYYYTSIYYIKLNSKEASLARRLRNFI